jgi:signal transduction histidine kinase
MTMTHAPGVRRQSIRVALAATAVVGVVYLVVAAAVVLFSTRDLTAQIDGRLVDTFARVNPDQRPIDGPYDPGHDPGRPFGAPFLAWTIQHNGTILAAASTPVLPAALRTVTQPTTAVIDGSEMRVAGGPVGDDYVIVAQSMDQVGDAQRTIILGELLIAPVLLAFVFLGATLIGRRVGEPIEAARRRQLEFTADASHELRTPLSVIEAHTSLALTQPRDATWYHAAFVRVERESRRMRRLLEDMLWLARFDASQAAPVTEPVDLGVLAAQAADRFAAVAETRQLALTVHAPPSGAVIAAAPDLVDRLVGVLLDNACKYAPEGGAVDVTVAVDGGRASVTVDDSGPGIPAEDRQQIFDRFHRSAATASGTDGAGLGLAIGDAIVRATGGRWTVSASPAGGARFVVSWTRASLG